MRAWKDGRGQEDGKGGGGKNDDDNVNDDDDEKVQARFEGLAIGGENWSTVYVSFSTWAAGGSEERQGQQGQQGRRRGGGLLSFELDAAEEDDSKDSVPKACLDADSDSDEDEDAACSSTRHGIPTPLPPPPLPLSVGLYDSSVSLLSGLYSSSTSVGCVKVDRSGHVWMALGTGGVAVLRVVRSNSNNSSSSDDAPLIGGGGGGGGGGRSGGGVVKKQGKTIGTISGGPSVVVGSAVGAGAGVDIVDFEFGGDGFFYAATGEGHITRTRMGDSFKGEVRVPDLVTKSRR